MDRGQEEMQFLGLFDIFKESYKIISSCRKLFTKITLALILPLSFIYLVHVQVSSLFSSKLQLDHIRSDTAEYENSSNLISHEALYFLLFNFVYFTLFFIFSLLSTAAVVYTIACIYTARELTFKTIITVVPKVWKYFLEYFCCHFSLSLCSCPCLDYLGSFSGTNARYRCCNVSRFSGFVHCGALLFGHNLALGYHCICFRRGIWVCSHGEEQKPYQRKARVGDSRVFYPVTDDGVKSYGIQEAGCGRNRHGHGYQGCVCNHLFLVAFHGDSLPISHPDSGLLCLQIVPPRKHRQIFLVGSPGSLHAGRLCSFEG
ncbi:hypothetical protein E1A91_A05G256200v1 [Gossypium mustelinum]|uniref:Uncharacterized protein n=1 Tax=Gossypium mustelinum TaxID=34275 RepID=A0A5D2ZDS8_GOSMU|nr:hypothetical protein E1A91_A05G256200v1 [Gossypium mustelinum]